MMSIISNYDKLNQIVFICHRNFKIAITAGQRFNIRLYRKLIKQFLLETY